MITTLDALIAEMADYLSSLRKSEPTTDAQMRGYLDGSRHAATLCKDRLQALRSDLLAASTWQSINSAPKDEKPVLIEDSFGRHRIAFLYPRTGEWLTEPGRYPVTPRRWMPLPPLPPTPQE